jgi:hypothetical protein
VFRILSKIFRKRIRIVSFVFSGFGLCLGLTLVLFSLRFYFGIVVPAQKEIDKADFIVISKNISYGNTLFNSKAKFSEEEIKDLKSQNFTTDLATFNSSDFQVRAYVDRFAFMTDLFFESLPAEFIDNCPSDFRWNEGENFIPIMVSEDFINLYNYTFAPENGLPQVPPSALSMIPVKIKMKGNRGEMEMKGRIVGLSERINSVLVPDNFLRWANKQIGDVNSSDDAARLVLKANKEYASNMQEYMEKQGYQVNSERMNQSKTSSYANVLSYILVILGVLFIAFSFIIVLQNFALILGEARQDMILLLQLGYKINAIVKFLFSVLISYVGVVAVISSVAYIILYGILSKYLLNRNLESGMAVTSEVVVALILSCVLLLLTGLFSISNRVKKYS